MGSLEIYNCTYDLPKLTIGCLFLNLLYTKGYDIRVVGLFNIMSLYMIH